MLKYQKGYIFNGYTFVVNKEDVHNATDDMFVDAAALLPVSDLVPVVRCGECKYYIRELMSQGSWWCECLERGEYEKHFCSYGQRKEGADNG